MTRGTRKDRCLLWEDGSQRWKLYYIPDSSAQHTPPAFRTAHIPPSFRTFRHIPDSTLSQPTYITPSPSTSSLKQQSNPQIKKPSNQPKRSRRERGQDQKRRNNGGEDVRAGDSSDGSDAAPARRSRRRGRRQVGRERADAHLRPRRARHGGHPGRRQGAPRRVLVRGGHAGAGHGRHQGAGGGRAGAGDQRRAAPGGARGRQVPAYGAADGQVHAQVRAPGERRHGQDLSRVPRRRAHGHRPEAAAAGAQEAQDHRRQGRVKGWNGAAQKGSEQWCEEGKNNGVVLCFIA
jgi:hypothetical protein